MNAKRCMVWNRVRKRGEAASLTVEAALVLPLFLFGMMALLYFIQVFLLQEQIQSAVTRLGLTMAKTAYLYDEFKENINVPDFDDTVFGEETGIGLNDLAAALIDPTVLKLYAGDYLNTDSINRSCIKNGYDGISFNGSELFKDNQWIDILVQYHIRLPIKLFSVGDMPMIQRIRVRAWTGIKIAATYSLEEDAGSEETVYVTETGTVYHKSSSCSHISLSIRAVHGIPTELRNDNGAKYYPCESCAKGTLDELSTFYITSDGNRYHTRRDCSRIKRNVTSIPVSRIGSRTPCKRCWK